MKEPKLQEEFERTYYASEGLFHTDTKEGREEIVNWWIKKIALERLLAAEEENDRWMNQPANEHDKRIREDEREKVVREIREKVGNMSKINAMYKEEIDQEIGYNEALEDVLDVLKTFTKETK